MEPERNDTGALWFCISKNRKPPLFPLPCTNLIKFIVGDDGVVVVTDRGVPRELSDVVSIINIPPRVIPARIIHRHNAIVVKVVSWNEGIMVVVN